MRLQVFILLFSGSLMALAQTTDYKKEKESVEFLLSNELMMDSLVDNALKNSYYLKSFEGELAQQYENVTQEKNKWISTFRVGINFFSLNTTTNATDHTSTTTAGILPTLGFSLGLDPEKFVNRKSYIREAQYNIVRAENQLKHQRRQIRDEIIRLYYQYLEALGLLELNEAANETQKEHSAVVEEKFKKGEARMEEVLLNQSAFVLTQQALLKNKLLIARIKQEIELFTSDSEKDLPTGKPSKRRLK